MNLIVLSVAVIAFLIAVLAIYLYTLGALLAHTANSLGDCSKSVQNISRHAGVIAPSVTRINQTGKELAGALPLLYEGAERLVAQAVAPAVTPVGVGYLDS